jgi:hypothetical protein
MKLFMHLRQRNPLLFNAAVLNMLGAVVMVVLILIDSAQILGINRWIKPFKFFISICIFLATFGWLSGDLPNKRFVRIFSWQIILAMLVEIGAIATQAVRGEFSHFNRNSVSGAIIFALMGVFVLYNTIWVGIFTYHYWKTNLSQLPASYVAGARLGLLLFLIGSFLGGYMSSQTGHTVGGIDGGPGIPLVNWSTHYGDLRVAHFFGLHGIQLLMILGLLLPKYSLPDNRARNLVVLLFLVLTTFVLWTFFEALHETPFLRLSVN